jgi:nicotinamide-nucleotide amidase
MDDSPPGARLAARLAAAGETLAVAEGHTGGRVCARLTARPGASEFFERGHVVYSYDSLRAELAVPRELLDAYGAVSEEVAAATARGVRDVADATWGVATTGIAGPGGGDPERPVGTTFVGVAYAAPWGSEASYARAERHEFDGDRAAVLEAATDAAVEAVLAATDDRPEERR